jgi:hypothetical protein
MLICFSFPLCHCVPPWHMLFFCIAIILPFFRNLILRFSINLLNKWKYLIHCQDVNLMLEVTCNGKSSTCFGCDKLECWYALVFHYVIVCLLDICYFSVLPSYSWFPWSCVTISLLSCYVVGSCPYAALIFAKWSHRIFYFACMFWNIWETSTRLSIAGHF